MVSYILPCLLFLWGHLHQPQEKAMAPHSGTLAWKITWTEEPDGLQSMGSLRVGHDWATFHFHALEKEMATHSSVLAWRIPGTGEPGGLPSVGSHRVEHDWSDSTVNSNVNHKHVRGNSYILILHWIVVMWRRQWHLEREYPATLLRQVIYFVSFSCPFVWCFGHCPCFQLFCFTRYYKKRLVSILFKKLWYVNSLVTWFFSLLILVMRSFFKFLFFSFWLHQFFL